MENIFVEGIQGSGKSTLVGKISSTYPELCVCREGDYSPVDLAWCTWMTADEYTNVLDKYSSIREDIETHTHCEDNHFIVSYTQVLTDIPGFHKDLEKYEIYNGRKSLLELKSIVFERFQRFRDTGYIFECAFFQNIVEDLILFHQLTDDEIMEFYKELFEQVDKKHFRLYYIYSKDIAENIQTIRKERCDEHGTEIWFQMMLEYFESSPYGQHHTCCGLADLLAHFEHRQELEMRIVREIVGEKAQVIDKHDREKL